MNTDLIIIGGGAAGLMAACRAGELGLKCVVLERRHRVGLKLLMCGNNRCNVSHQATVDQMLTDYGEPVGDFLRPAIERFSPMALRNWFAKHGLATCVKGVRIYPTTENADDVLHCFTDCLRDEGVPLMLNCPVTAIRQIDGGFEVTCERVTLQAKQVLMATGGVSYPKTGSVGDGQRMLSELGIEVTELRAGLAGVEVSNDWLKACEKTDFEPVRVTVTDAEGRIVGTTNGNMLCEQGTLRGSAIFDAVRMIARKQLTSFGMSVAVKGKTTVLEDIMIRPIKEAIVTVGGAALSEVNNQTMEVTRMPGLYVAGELLDVDGPTGGYNLHAAFATARLAVESMAHLAEPVSQKSHGADRTQGSGFQKDRSFQRNERRPQASGNGKKSVSYGHREESGAQRKKEWGGTKLDEQGKRIGSGKSHCDSKPGNRWDNSELMKRWKRPEK